MLLSALSLNSRFAQLGVAAILCFALLRFLHPPSFDITHRHRVSAHRRPGHHAQPSSPAHQTVDHPIDQLVNQARDQFANLLAQESSSLEDAARAYRERRGRHPPPGFDVWFEYATTHSAVIVEEFWDAIYDDLDPFWGMPAHQIRRQAHDFPYTISVRHGKVEASGFARSVGASSWIDMVESVAQYLPDLDIPINHMDESRVVVPWEEINEYMQNKLQPRIETPPKRTKFSSLSALDAEASSPWEPYFEREGPYWQLAVVGCAPDSPARHAYLDVDYTRPPPLQDSWPQQSHQGYVQNWTLVRSPCDNPHLQGLHGAFVEPISIATTQTLFPLFGGAKLQINNDILWPSAGSWSDELARADGDWDQKEDVLMWRGPATGGRNRESTWTRFQRHRFVAMLNASSVYLADEGHVAPNFVLPNANAYPLSSREPSAAPGALSTWVDSWADAALTDLVCFPSAARRQCPYTDPYFTLARESSSSQTAVSERHKYLADLDGNAASPSFQALLHSTALPLKATLYREWHDARLVPWKHFVPLDNSFIDVYGVMQYFVGDAVAGLAGHDDVAQHIAQSGREWAQAVLRKEDMSVYVLRLLLEFARLCDEDREIMGWAEAPSLARQDTR